MLRVALLSIFIGFVVWKSWRRPTVAAAALLASFALEQYVRAHVPFFADNSAAANYLIAGFIAVALAFVIVQRRPVFRDLPKTAWWLLALYGWALVTTVWAVDVDFSLATWRDKLPYLVLWAGVAPLLFSRSEDIRDFVWSTLLIGGASLVLLMLDSDWQARTIVIRGAHVATDQSENPLAVASLGGSVAVVAILVAVGQRWRMRLFLFGLALLGLAATVRSGSRGQFFAAIIATALTLPLALPPRQLAGWSRAFFTLSILTMVAYWAFDSYAEGPRWELETMNLVVRETRGELAVLGVQAWASSGTFYLFAGLGSSSCFDILGFYPHVVPVEVLIEEGLIGIVLYLGLLFATSKAGWNARNLALGSDETTRSVIAAVVGLTIFTGALTLKEGSLLGNVGFPMFVVILGRAESILRHERHERHESALAGC